MNARSNSPRAIGRIDKIAHVRMMRELKLDQSELKLDQQAHTHCVWAERLCATGFAITILTGILPVRANNCSMQVRLG